MCRQQLRHCRAAFRCIKINGPNAIEAVEWQPDILYEEI